MVIGDFRAPKWRRGAVNKKRAPLLALSHHPHMDNEMYCIHW